MSGEFNNKLDNSDVPIKENKQTTVGGYFQSPTQAAELKLYLENLKLIADIQAKDKASGGYNDIEIEQVVGYQTNGTPIKKKIKIVDMLPKEDEFQRCRRVIIVELNKMKDDDLRVWMARFGSDNIFELSGLITSYGLDKKKREAAFDKFNIWKP